MMRIVIPKAILLIIVLVDPNAASDRRTSNVYHAVSPIAGLEWMYLNTKPPSATLKLEDPEFSCGRTHKDREKICYTVVCSEYFSNHLHVYPAIKPEGGKANETSRENISLKQTSFPIEEYEVVVKKRTFRERLFPCSTISYETGNVVEFFITELYGQQSRFLFKYNEDNKLVLVAIADLSPVLYGLHWMAGSKLSTAFFNKFVEDGNFGHHEICDMGAAEKDRICNIILNADEFREECQVRYKPSRLNDPPCEKLKLKLPICTTNAWAVHCKAVFLPSRVPQTYYLMQESRPGAFLLTHNKKEPFMLWECFNL